MHTAARCLRRAALPALVALLLSAPAGARAQIAVCDSQPVAQVFLQWADPSWYASMPDGGLEAGGAGWALSGAAAVVEGNEPYYVRAASDRRSLALGPGASAVSPSVCIGPGHPTVRFFVRSQKGAQATLSVAVEFFDTGGIRRSVPIGLIAASPTWRPSPILPVVTNLLSPLIGYRASFRFTPSGDSDWYVDDLYVDPYGKG